MRFTVSKKILIAFSILIFIILGISLLSIYELSKVNTMVDNLYEKQLLGISHIKEAQINVLSSQRAEKNLILSKSFSEQTKHAENIKKYNSLVEENIENFKPTVITDEVKQQLNEIEKIWQEVKTQQEKVIELNSQGRYNDALQISTENRENVDKLEEDIDKIAEIKDGQGKKDHNEIAEAYLFTRNILIVIMIISITVSGIVSYYISRIISKPIVAMAASAARIANGDLTTESIKVKNKDEIGDLASSFNTMTDNLKSIIEKVVDSSQNVASYSEELYASSEETASATEQVTNSILQVADGANKQSEELEAASASLEEISATVQQTASNTENIANSSIEVSSHANQGVEEVENAINKIEVVRQVSLNTGDVVRDLGKQSEKIGQIVDVIKNIADQTNLLALNAAIEAARAGEQGRGFAVVANEVTKLAEESSNAAQEVAELVNNIQYKANNAIKVIDEGNKDIYNGVDAVNKAGETFKAIASQINGVVVQIQEISAAIEQIANGDNEIVESINNIAAISEETAASSQEVTAASEEQSASMEEIAKSSQELANLAQELQSAVSIFKY